MQTTRYTPDPGSYTVGVDIGGTNTLYALVDTEGRILKRGSMPTRTGQTAEEFFHSLAQRIKGLTDGIDPSAVAGIGVGIPCANAYTGCVEAATDLPWPSPVPVARLLEDYTGLMTFISNDANAAAVGEMKYGVARGMRDFLMLTLGTGVGGGVVCDGNVLSGSRGFAGELGHISTPKALDRMCSCGRPGCLQTVASASGVVETARRMLLSSDLPSLLRDTDPSSLTAAMIGRAADGGDPLALKVFEFTGDVVGEACASYAAMTDPDAIVLFGGVARAARHFIPYMRRALEREALHLYRDRIEILVSSLPDADAAVLGAAALPLVR